MKAMIDLPTITTGMIVSREGKIPDRAIKSVQNQIYFKYFHKQFLIVYNKDKKRTIGNCWNEIVDNATGEYVFLMDDDDMISVDYLFTLALSASMWQKKLNNLAGVTTHVMAYIPEADAICPVNRTPTGMIKTKICKKFRFDEKLKNHVDSEFLQRINDAGHIVKVLTWNYSYLYRQHDENVSGRMINVVK